MKKLLGLILVSTSLVFATGCQKEVASDVGLKNGLPHDGIQAVIPTVQIAVDELEGNKITETKLQEAIEEKLVITAPDSANVVSIPNRKVKVDMKITREGVSENQEILVRVDTEVEQYKSSNPDKQTENATQTTVISTLATVVVVPTIQKIQAEITGFIEDITPTVSMEVTAESLVSNLKIVVDGQEYTIDDNTVYQLYDSLVDYSTPGNYAVQLHLGKKDKRTKDIFVPVRVNAAKVETRAEIEKYYNLDWTTSIRCKETFNYGKQLYIPSEYINPDNANETIKIKEVGYQGCISTATRVLDNVERIIIAKGIENIQPKAFELHVGTSKLSRIYLPEGLTTINDDFLKGHNKLELLLIPSSTNSTTVNLSVHALEGLEGLTHVIVKEMPTLHNLNDSHWWLNYGSIKYSSDNFKVFSGIGKKGNGEALNIQIVLPTEYKFNIDSFSPAIKNAYNAYVLLLKDIGHSDHLVYYNQLDRTVLYKHLSNRLH